MAANRLLAWVARSERLMQEGEVLVGACDGEASGRQRRQRLAHGRLGAGLRLDQYARDAAALAREPLQIGERYDSDVRAGERAGGFLAEHRRDQARIVSTPKQQRQRGLPRRDPVCESQGLGGGDAEADAVCRERLARIVCARPSSVGAPDRLRRDRRLPGGRSGRPSRRLFERGAACRTPGRCSTCGSRDSSKPSGP